MGKFNKASDVEVIFHGARLVKFIEFGEKPEEVPNDHVLSVRVGKGDSGKYVKFSLKMTLGEKEKEGEINGAYYHCIAYDSAAEKILDMADTAGPDGRPIFAKGRTFTVHTWQVRAGQATGKPAESFQYKVREIFLDRISWKTDTAKAAVPKTPSLPAALLSPTVNEGILNLDDGDIPFVVK